jgi:uncharacterized YceG family protein
MSRFFGKSDPAPPRTAAERERERVARERRRAGLDPEPEPAVPPPVEPDPVEAHEAAEVAAPPVPAPEAQPAEAAVAEPEPDPAEPLAAAADDVPEAVEHGYATDAAVPLAAGVSVSSSAAPGDDNPLPPPPPRRSGGIAPPPTRGQDPGRSGRGPGSGTAGTPKRRLTGPRILALVVVLLAAAAVWFGVELFEPFTGSGHGRVVVSIPRGDGASQIGDLLAKRGVVSSGFFFNLYAAVEGERGDLHSGTYTLRRDMSYSSALSLLTQPPPAPPTVDVVVPEGDSRPEIAARARADGLSGSYLAASISSPLLSPTHYGAPRGTPNLEGFLFPDTYTVRAGADVRNLVGQQLTAFEQNVGPAFKRAAHHQHLTLYQLLIVASMIEREAYLSADRAKVAAVIYNRLRLAMPLGIDATLRFALNDWTRPLTESQLQQNTPYNTRLHIGLPPTPIGNPGLASLAAAAHPAHVPYLYYVAGADGCGELVFSTNSADFDRDAAAYQAALAANHGRVPTCHRHG